MTVPLRRKRAAARAVTSSKRSMRVAQPAILRPSNRLQSPAPKVLIIGRGQVGRALTSALRARAVPCALRAYRAKLPKRLPPADLIVLCCRDRQLTDLVARLVATGLPGSPAVAHVSGTLAVDVLAPLRQKCSGIAQMHPYFSITSGGGPMGFHGVPFLVRGDRAATTIIARVLMLLEATRVSVKELDAVRYHLSAALLANGTVALLHEAGGLLQASGIPKSKVGSFLAALLGSVLENIKRCGPARALTGPVRRQDLGTLERHLGLLSKEQSPAKGLYRELILAQLRITEELGELEPRAARRIRRRISTF